MDEYGARPPAEAAPTQVNATRMIGSYYQTQLRSLLGQVRNGFEKLDTGRLDVFELDELIHHYRRSATALWEFCGSSGSERAHAAEVLADMRRRGAEPDWWEAGT